MSRSLWSVVVASGHSQRADLLDALFDANDYDVVFVESIAHGYSRIKRVMPDLVIVMSELDDAAACQLLSMLKIDGDLSRIPVVTCATRHVESERADDIVGWDRYPPSRTLAIPMN